MFVGHFAVALAARRVAPRLGLPLLTFAVVFLDVLWPLFILVGLEHGAIVPGITAASPLDLSDYPYSHSLLFVVLWSSLFAAPLLVRRRPFDAVVLGACVFSHFVLDVVSHRPDVPLYPGSAVELGFGLWNSVPATLLVEGGLFAVAIAFYARATQPIRAFGRWGFIALNAVLTLAWVGGVLGPPPPSIEWVAMPALGFIVLCLVWVWRIDGARRFRSPLAAVTAG